MPGWEQQLIMATLPQSVLSSPGVRIGAMGGKRIPLLPHIKPCYVNTIVTVRSLSHRHTWALTAIIQIEEWNGNEMEAEQTSVKQRYLPD